VRFFSSVVVVNPANWNVDRGAANVVVNITDQLNLTIAGNIKATAIRIYDATGRLPYNRSINGNRQLKLSTRQLPKG